MKGCFTCPSHNSEGKGCWGRAGSSFGYHSLSMPATSINNFKRKAALSLAPDLIYGMYGLQM